MTNASYTHPNFHHRGQESEPVLLPKKTPKDLSADNANAQGIKRLQRLRKVEAEMR
jgi:hypothetical protein